jgi:acyl-coenzyme A synthetase/AMP-(fatty) acid ligase
MKDRAKCRVLSVGRLESPGLSAQRCPSGGGISMYPEMVDYEQTCREFRWEVPEHYNFAFDVIDRWGEDAEKLAMLWVNERGAEKRLTFRDFTMRSNQVGNALRTMSIRKGERILIMSPRLPEWWEAVLGIMKIGAISMPGTTLLTPKDVAYRIQAAEAVAVITDEEGVRKVEQVADECPTLRLKLLLGAEREGWVNYTRAVASAMSTLRREPTRGDEPMMIYFTSGTVGYPKMVLHTHVSYPIGHVVTGKYWLDLKPTDLHWNLSDTGWAKAAYSNLFGPWIMGAAMFTFDGRGRFDARQTLDLLERYPISTFCAPPTAYRLLVLENLSRYRLSALRHCIGAGEPLNPEVIEAWQLGTGQTIRDGYGQTETVILVANFPPLPVKPGSMGKPSPGFTVGVVDDDGREVRAGTEGDIAVKLTPMRPVGMFKEYWRNPEATSNCSRGEWYITGDRAIKDDDGYFWFVGRADDVIISAGYRIGPFEVESALVEHPSVAEAAVVASPDRIRGDIVKAFVVLAPGHQPSEQLTQDLQEHVKRVTAPYKYPREIEFTTELPKTISGKIRRVELRQRERDRKAVGRPQN